MDLLGSEVLKMYGLSGVIVLFAGWLVIVLLRHFLQKDNKKDDQIVKMAETFSAALDRNTIAINQLNQSELQLSNAAENIVKGFDRTAAQNREEHRKILDYIIDDRSTH